MRIINSLLIWVIIIGGISVYMNHQRSGEPHEPDEIVTVDSAAPCTFELTATFSAEPDPFALSVGGEETGDALILKLGDKTLLKTSEAIQAGIPYIVGPVSDIKNEVNEVYLKASPPADNFDRHNALRLRVVQEGQTIAETTLWASPGELISGTLQFEPTMEEGNDDH